MRKHSDYSFEVWTELSEVHTKKLKSGMFSHIWTEVTGQYEL